MAKNLIINCASCDTRSALPETYSQYESITINASTVLTNAAGKALLSALPITLNCANVVEIEEGAELRTVNGRAEIRSSDRVPDNRFVLHVNGALTIGPDTQAYLEQCAGMTVNGTVLYPRSMAPWLGAMTVNGSSACYPDGAIVLKRNAVIDRLFALRAKESLYWSPNRMILVDPELDPRQLHGKGCRFAAREVILAQSLVEALIDLIDEEAEIIIVPDGTSVVLDDLTLDRKALRRYGRKLYVVGDVTVPRENDCLDQLQYLKVRGDILTPPEQREKLLDVLTDLTGEIRTVRPSGSVLGDRPYLKITGWMLDRHPTGVEVRDCMVVSLSADLSREQILQRLQITDCGLVRCSADQEDAVSMVCTDVGQITTQGEEEGAGLGTTLRSALTGLSGSPDTRVINAADYVM